ncbi:MAG TPA: enoyl-CoA hydratase/isomerase family protein [Candidatus Dormibacteraeota bacterium]|nr:enoyl-CoA hydratase/isomerase family protein [Candidatus Dormibacteraeota bacterium]
MSQDIVVERLPDRPVVRLTLNRPEKRNTISWEMRQTIGDIAGDLGRDRSVRVIIVTGAGGCFSSGGDMRGFLEREPYEFAHLGENLATVEEIPQPVIAAVDGYCFGAGFELALMCDIRVCSDRAEFALPEITRGQIPGSGGSQRLSRLIGWSRAKEMILRGRRMGAEEALHCGLVCEVVPAPELEAASLRIADELCRYSPLALATLKSTLNHGMDTNLGAAMEIERKAYAMLRSTHDYVEGVRSFFEKREPRYEDR